MSYHTDVIIAINYFDDTEFKTEDDVLLEQKCVELIKTGEECNLELVIQLLKGANKSTELLEVIKYWVINGDVEDGEFKLDNSTMWVKYDQVNRIERWEQFNHLTELLKKTTRENINYGILTMGEEGEVDQYGYPWEFNIYENHYISCDIF
jgi:hypothetical protein